MTMLDDDTPPPTDNDAPTDTPPTEHDPDDYTPASEQPTGPLEPPPVEMQTGPELDPSWQRQALHDALSGHITRPTPTLLRFDHQDDGLCYPGRVNGLHGDSGTGKSWVAAIAVAQQLADGHHAIWIDFEDPDPTTLVERLRTLDIHDDEILEQLHYYGPTEPFTDLAIDEIVRDVAEHPVTLVVIDSIGEAFGLEGIDENHDVEVGPWMRHVARRIADTGPGLLILDHATKAADNPLHPSGSKRKRAAITGSSFLLEAINPLTRENGGRLRLLCAKDRHGNFARGHEIAIVEMNVYPDGPVIKVRNPAPSERREGPSGPALEAIMVEAIEVVRRSARPLSQSAVIAKIRDRKKVKGSTDRLKAALEEAVAHDCLATEPGPRGATRYVFQKEFDDDDAE